MLLFHVLSERVALLGCALCLVARAYRPQSIVTISSFKIITYIYIRAELKCRARLSDSKAKQLIETIPSPFSERSIIILIITMLPNQASYSTIVVMASKNTLTTYIQRQFT